MPNKPKTFKNKDRKPYDAKRGTAQERGYTKKWARTRKYVLARDMYICGMCHRPVGDGEHAHVDHIVPAKEWTAQGNDFHDLSNLQTLCRWCHHKKTQEERKANG